VVDRAVNITFMRIVHMAPEELEFLIEQRRNTGAGFLDECWEGIWHLTDPTERHQEIAGWIYRIHAEVVQDAGKGIVRISINVTDREENWKHNHRCPDGVVILKGNPGRWVGKKRVAFLGGPDFVLEVESEEEDARLKLPFYRLLGVREVLIVDQENGTPELFRLEGGDYRSVEGVLRSAVTGLEYSGGSMGLQIRDPTSGRAWVV
jgi:Uma2 family endonuclease